ncbi:MAG: hypothetical protein J0I07_04625 [Myxococcales bacterium]|nr:hypothetical protein [Myxococcales bacterium]
MSSPSHMRVATVALVAALALAPLSSACRPSGGSTSDARITVTESGGEIVLGSRKASLPTGDVGKDAPAVTQDEAGRRLAYRTPAGMARILYVIGDGLFVGPLVAFPVDFRAAPDTDHALGPLFEAAGPRRAELVREVRREKGEGGVVRLLIDAAYVDDPAWEETRKQVPPANEAALRDGLASGLEAGKSAIALRRAVGVLDLKAPARAKLVAARAKELAAGGEEPKAVAVLLRAVIANDKQKAAEIGCEVLAKRAAAPADDAMNSLVEAATLAIAAADATCPDPKLVESVLAEPCLPYYRCGAAGPVAWSDTSKQDEPLCTKAELAKAIASELERATRDVLDDGTTRPGLFAYASLLSKDRLPAAFVNAHARRRYALTQPAEPPCDGDLAPSTACHCEEATLRLYACKQPEASIVHIGVCRFVVDDKQKKIHNVVATPPP